MNRVVRKLRRADEQQLRGLEAALGRGHFVIVVVDDAAWPIVRSAIGVEASGEFTLENGGDVVQMFDSPAAAGEGVVFLHIGEPAADAMLALNLNRDKLLSRKCRFLLRLRGLEAFQRFVREAPDCYSIRDAVALIEPQKAIDLEPSREPEPDVEHQIANERSPDALLALGKDLIMQNRLHDAHRALDRGIALLKRKKRLVALDRLMLAALHFHRCDGATKQERRIHVQEALRVLGPVREEFSEEYTKLLSHLSDYYGSEIAAVREAHDAAEQEDPRNPDFVTQQLIVLVGAYLDREDVRGARDALGQTQIAWFATENRLFMHRLEAFLLSYEGRWKEATHKLQDSLRQIAQAGPRAWIHSFAATLSELLISQGELGAAVDVMASIKSEQADQFRLNVRRSQGELAAFRGIEDLADVTAADGDLSGALTRASASAGWVRLAVRAGLLEEESLERMDAAIKALVSRVVAVAPATPPWSRIEAELLAADNLLARAGSEHAATEPAERALALARVGAPELIAACVRRVAVAALRSGSVERLDVLLDDAARAAEAHHLPGEAARIAGLRLWYAVQRGAAVGDAEEALEAAFARSGHVLVQAAVLLRVGRGAGRRDLVSRARRIYHALPWPEREGACLEALGMPQAARDRYEAFGLRLAALAVDRSPVPVDA
ncbi:hypothetical protein WMF11_22770 [Sorangium sp. So ce295]|uniref:hypothetical protein n=1 Tax=Sorangium sp. So ce295 TaxID=3133295 RepID=UPI003F621A23